MGCLQPRDRVSRPASGPHPDPGGANPRGVVIGEVIAQLDATLTSVRTAVDEVGKLDAASQDVVIEIARGLEKDRWFLFAHLAST